MRKSSGDCTLFRKCSTAVVFGLLFLFTSSVAGEQRERPTEQIFQLLTALGTDIGVTARNLNPSAPEAPLGSGAVLEDVSKDSPASRAGMIKGDIVVEFDGQIIYSGRQFARVVQATVPGKTVKATIVRGGQKRELSVTVPLRSTNRR